MKAEIAQYQFSYVKAQADEIEAKKKRDAQNSICNYTLMTENRPKMYTGECYIDSSHAEPKDRLLPNT
jgi:hypothetical protein